MPPDRTKRRERDQNYQHRIRAAKHGLARGHYRSISEAASMNGVPSHTLSDRANCSTHDSAFNQTFPSYSLAEGIASFDGRSSTTKFSGPRGVRSAARALVSRQLARRWSLPCDGHFTALNALTPPDAAPAPQLFAGDEDASTHLPYMLPHSLTSYTTPGHLLFEPTPDDILDSQMSFGNDTLFEGDAMPSDSGSLVTDGSDAPSFASDDYSDICTPPSPTVSIDTICKRMEKPFNQEDDKRSFAEMQMELFKYKFKCQLLDRQRSQVYDQLTQLDTSALYSPQDDSLETPLDSSAAYTPKFVNQLHAFDSIQLDPRVGLSRHGTPPFMPNGITIPHADIIHHIPSAVTFAPSSGEPPW